MTSPKLSSSASINRKASAAPGWGDRLGVWWQDMAPRERSAVSFAAWVVGLALLWWVLLGPAIATLQRAPAQHAALDAQLNDMQTMAASVEQLRSQNSAPTPSRNAALSSLELATSQLGESAQITIQGDRATLMLRGTAPADLAQWLGQVRVNARVLPISAQIKRQDNPDGWHGQITVSGPGLGATSP